jgi:multidrug resistance efflux pump
MDAAGGTPGEVVAARALATSAATPAVVVTHCVSVGVPASKGSLAAHALVSVVGGAATSVAVASLPEPLPGALPSAAPRVAQNKSRLRDIAEQALVRAKAPPTVAAPAPSGATIAAPVAPAPASIPRPAEPTAPPQRALFRQEALDAHYGADGDAEALAQPRAGAWSVLLVLASLVGVLFVAAAIASVEVTVKAPGALRAPNGLRSVESALAGAISEVLTQAGAEVVEGQVVVRLEDAKLRSNLVLRERQLETLREEIKDAAADDQALIQRTLRASKRQRGVLQRRTGIGHGLLKKRSDRLADVQALVQYGAASHDDLLKVDELVQAASESVVQLDSQLVELDLQMADRMREWQAHELERRTSLSRMNAQVEEARSLLTLVEIRSPAAGRVESLLAKVGKVAQAGEIMAQIVPTGAPRSIVAFLPSRETAFVAVGSEANVEVESLPVNEFGMARARVVRVSADVAQQEELASTFGEALAGSFVRVELELLEGPAQDKMAPHLRSGERVMVRLHSRERRVLSLLFEFVRKWLDQ